MSSTTLSSHSTEVEMYLDCGAHGCFKLKRITPQSVVMWNSTDAPPCHGKLAVYIDGQLHERPVYIASGLSRTRLAAKVEPIDDVAPF